MKKERSKLTAEDSLERNLDLLHANLQEMKNKCYDFRNQQMTIIVGGEVVDYLFDLIDKACLQFVDYKYDLKALFQIINNNEDIVMTSRQEKVFDKYYQEYLERMENQE